MRFVVVLLVASRSTAACSPSRHEPRIHRVAIQGMQFVPAELTARVGDTVVWTNDDIVPHTATAPGMFDSGVIASKAEWSLVVKDRGSISYTCTLHPTMKATLTTR
jgi:plastocyanin